MHSIAEMPGLIAEDNADAFYSGMVAGGDGGQYIEVFVRFKKMGSN